MPRRSAALVSVGCVRAPPMSDSLAAREARAPRVGAGEGAKRRNISMCVRIDEWSGESGGLVSMRVFFSQRNRAAASAVSFVCKGSSSLQREHQRQVQSEDAISDQLL